VGVGGRLSFLHPHTANHRRDPSRVPGHGGNPHPNIWPYDTFAMRTVPISSAVGNDSQFAKLCELIGAPKLPSDPRFATNQQRNAHRDELKWLLKAKLAHFDCKPLADCLVRAGVPCAPIHDVPAALADPHTKQRGMVVEIGDEYRGVASPIKLSRTSATYRMQPPSKATR
jgi:crotonobetainyl-CoA:carnitine CoA-transferase CaiB-like acyl-CoA transferase